MNETVPLNPALEKSPPQSPAAAPSRDESAARYPLARIAGKYFLPAGDTVKSFLLLIVVTGTDVVVPILLGQTIDLLVSGNTLAGRAEKDAAFRNVLEIVGAMTALLFAQFFMHYLLRRIQNRVIYRGSARLRDDLYARLQSQSLNFHAEKRMGGILTNLLTDVQMLQDSCLDLILEMPFDLLILCGLVAAMYLRHPPLATFVVVFFAVVTGAALIIGREGWQNQERAMERTGSLASRLHEALNAVRTIYTFGAQDAEQETVRKAAQDHAEGLEDAGDTAAAVAPFFGFAEYVGMLIVLVIGGWYTLYGTLTPGTLVTFFAFMVEAAEPLSRGAQILPKFQRATVAARRITALLAETETPADPPGAKRPEKIAGAICYTDVAFTYPRGNKIALQGIAFEVNPGERIAIAGPNGAGKSTLLDLLLKLQRPSQGRIEIDGMDLGEIATDSWRRLIGIVPQDIFLLNRSIAANISLGLSGGDVEAAAKLAGVHDVIMRLPKGYQTDPGERGVFLSGGERQRIAIARLFYRDPRIVLLDEPTSALDVRSESDILPALWKLCEGRTTLIVSHRAAILNGADKVVLIADGKQLACDAPKPVWANFPAYRDLFPPEWGVH